ncbi:MAG TPA: UDP-N-acetylmuramate dehydrogenase [Candidatus Angelobacter sp.]|jgi:UDP-N-acetylmuramate dehydrogenase|nr:UDP-N-acetylmuramate dehydrogenase [Candidatus Angelobacter sp.]
MQAEWLDAEPGVRRNEPLARHTQYGIGGPADFFLTLHDPERLAELMPRCNANGVPFTVLGAGSNTLVLDGGIRGLVVRMSDRHMRVVDGSTVELSGGYMMPRAALDLARKGIAGIEFGIGIPGTTGASVRGNAGAFGSEIKDVMVACDTIDGGGAHHTFGTAECGFSYRDSRFKGDLHDHVIVAARFTVHRDDPVEVRARTDAIQAQRKASQPYGIRSLGSVFKNPPGDYAGRLVEAAGLRGRRVGGALISDKHANFIVNMSHASAADVLALAELAHDAVLEQFGVDLEREIVVLGETQWARR